MILDNMPHTFVAQKRTRVKDTVGGSKDSFATVSTGSCWHQQAGDSEVTEFSKRGIAITGKVFFTSDPALDETYVLTISNVNGVAVGTYEVVSYSEQDASAGLGVLWRCMVNRKTVEG